MRYVIARAGTHPAAHPKRVSSFALTLCRLRRPVSLPLLWRTAVMAAPDEDAVPLLALGDRSGEGMHADGAL
jgi:hypothetical protein